MLFKLASIAHRSGKSFLAFLLIFSLLTGVRLGSNRWTAPLGLQVAEAAVALVQTQTGLTSGNGGTSVSATFSPSPTADNLLVAVVGSPSSATFSITGWTLATSTQGTPSQAVFYRVATTSESATVTVSASASVGMGLHIYEYRGAEPISPLDAVGSASESATTTVRSGNVTTTQPDGLIFAAITHTASNVTFSGWTNSFAEENDFSNGTGNTANRASYAGADRIVSATGSYSTAAVTTLSGNYVGHIVAFKARILFEQSAYRWFNNANATSVGSPVAALNTIGTVSNAGDILRLRMLIHVSSSALSTSLRNFKLQYVERGAGSCASPAGTNPSVYTDVETSTGAFRFADNPLPANGDPLSSTSTDPTHGAHTVVNQTYVEQNTFTNSRGAILAGQDGKWDFAILNSSGQSSSIYCFRAVQSNGAVFDTYSQYPQIVVGNVEPVISNVTLNGGFDIALTEGTTTLIHASATVTDTNGFLDMKTLNGVFYRSGVTSTLSCAPNNNNCYIVSTSSCSFTNCSGNSCEADCTANIWFHADPTDVGTPWSSEGWQAWMKVTDASNASSSATSTLVDMLTLLGLQVTPSISYGSLRPGSTTDTLTRQVTVSSTGNSSMDLIVYGSAMSAGANSIPITQQRFATSSGVGYNSSSAHTATSSPGITIDANLKKSISTSTLATSTLWWGISVPNPQPTGNYTGINSFLGQVNSLPWP